MIVSRIGLLLSFLLLFFRLPVSGQPFISEFLAIHSTAGEPDKDGDASDWVEIHNPEEQPLDLTGWYLTDNPDNLTQWQFPSGIVPPGGHLILYASGKNFSSLFNPEIHANFSLSGDGEYLALVEPDGQTIAHEFAPAYPPQRRDISYGMALDGQTPGYFTTPTFAAANGAPVAGLVEPVRFSHPRGYYREPILLELHTETPGATIRYTLNGKAPSLFTAQTYSNPIAIDQTTIIRAHAIKDGLITTPLETHTYLFVDDVPQQDTMSTNVTEDPVYGPLIVDALMEHPAISLVTPDTDISRTEEDPTSVEMVFPDGTEGFQIDAGVKRVGGHSLNAYPKNNMRLYFRSEYGKEKLRYPLFDDHPYTDRSTNTFDQLNLRGGSHDSIFYLGANNQRPSNAQYLRNRWINDMQFLMGHESLRGRWVHVYINGIYWGHYQIMERPTQDYFASYLGGSKDDYVAVNRGQPIGSSDMASWNAMVAARNDYEEFQRRADIDNYIDYMLLNYYAGNDWDWNPLQNWAGGGPVEPETGGMKFIAWDSDIIFRSLTDNNLGKPGPHSMFPSLMNHEDFAIRVADRIQKHFHHDGWLTPDKVAEAYNFRAEQIRLSIIPETARWQNGRWTRDEQWQDELDRLNDDFFPNRTEIALNQLKARGWTGDINPPWFNSQGGFVDKGFAVTLGKSLFATGEIVYTTDGSDPRLPGGALSSIAQGYQGPIQVDTPTTVKARLHNRGQWSALIEATFRAGLVEATSENLTISKIHYRPSAPTPEETAAGFSDRGAFEFLELLNLGSTPISLQGIQFSDGIRFQFPDTADSFLGAGERALLVKDPEAFLMRFGEGLPIMGTFEKSLSNDGERLEIANGEGVVLQELTYNDADPWPIEADGDGAYLSLRTSEKAEPENPGQWNARPESELADDTPGDPTAGLTFAQWNHIHFRPEDINPYGDPDDDALVNLLEFALGTDPWVANPSPQLIREEVSGDIRLRLERAAGIADAELVLETSPDLLSWNEVTDLSPSTSPSPSSETNEWATFTLPPFSAPRYYRFRVKHTGWNN